MINYKSSTLELRDYQQEIIDQVNSIKHKKICVQLPTGCGKSVIAKYFIDRYYKRNNKVLVLVPNCTLVDNFRDYIDYSTYAYSGCKPDLSKKVLITTYASAKKYKKTFVPGLVVIDECHHTPTATILDLVESYPGVKIIGFTATPNRPDGLGLDTVFDDLVVSHPISWFIERGYLSGYNVYIPDTDRISFDSILSSAADSADMFKMLETVPQTKNTFQLWREKISNGRTIVFNFSIKHSKAVNSYFLQQGIKSAHIDGTVDADIRRSLLEDFRKGKIQVINNVNCLSEGADIPSIECVILNGFTKSNIMFLQRIGRGLRPKDGKELIVIDSGKNFLYHGDIKHSHQWSLKTISKKRKKHKAGYYYCCYCDGELGSKSEIWPQNLLSDPDIENYLVKKLCCTNYLCESHGDDMITNSVTYTYPKKPLSQIDKIDSRLLKYSKLDLNLAELNSVINKKRIKPDAKAERIQSLSLPIEVKYDALSIVYENDVNKQLKIKALIGK